MADPYSKEYATLVVVEAAGLKVGDLLSSGRRVTEIEGDGDRLVVHSAQPRSSMTYTHRWSATTPISIRPRRR